MDLFAMISIAIGIFAAGVFVGIISYACGQRLIVNKCNVIVGPDIDTIKKMVKQLKVYSNPDRLTLRRNGKKAANVVSINEDKEKQAAEAKR